MSVQTMVKPASEKQEAFIAKLLAEKQVSPAFAAEIKMMQENGGLTSKDASGFINVLLALPRIPTAAPDVELGYYVVGLDDTVFKVVKAKSSDNRYAKKMVLPLKGSGRKARWVYVAGALKLLEGLKPVTVEEAASYGHLHGFCCCCGAELTDPKSVQMGIGPVCAQKNF